MDRVKIGEQSIRLLYSTEISEAVRKLFVSVNYTLSSDVVSALERCTNIETDPLGKKVLCRLCDNLSAANELSVPICQDTGLAVVFADVGEDIHIVGDTLENAINQGVRDAYVHGKMRLSIVKDPLYNRENTNDNTPAIIHIRYVKGDKLSITAAPKGFGSENMSSLRMFTPSASEKDIIDYVVDTVKKAGSNPCPPIVVGVGIGGNFEYCAYLSKRALTRSLDDKNPIREYALLETKLLETINALGIGPQGFGGDTTALAVKVEAAPTHIAGLPVAVNINCHVARHKSVIL